MKRSIAFVYVLGLFLLGILIGALGMHLWQANQTAPGPLGMRGNMRPPRHEAGHRPGRRPGPFFLERLGRQLDLSPEQERQIAEIIEESHREAGALREEILPKVEAQLDQTRERILEVLTEEQRERFEEFDRRHRRILERGVLGH